MQLDAVKNIADAITGEGILCEPRYGSDIPVEDIAIILESNKPKAFLQGSIDFDDVLPLSTRGAVVTLNGFLTTIAAAPKTAVEMLMRILGLAMIEDGQYVRMGFEKNIGGIVFKDFRPQFQVDQVARPNGKAFYCQQLMRFTYEVPA